MKCKTKYSDETWLDSMYIFQKDTIKDWFFIGGCAIYWGLGGLGCLNTKCICNKSMHNSVIFIARREKFILKSFLLEKFFKIWVKVAPEDDFLHNFVCLTDKLLLVTMEKELREIISELVHISFNSPAGQNNKWIVAQWLKYYDANLMVVMVAWGWPRYQGCFTYTGNIQLGFLLTKYGLSPLLAVGIVNPLGNTFPASTSGTGIVLGRDWSSNLSTYSHSWGS